MYNPNTYFFIGLTVHLTFWAGYKLLKNKLFMGFAIATSALLALIAFNMQGIESLQMKGGYAANWFFTPALFLITYILFRYIFKLLFKNEPIMASYRATSWDQAEYRRLHAGDSIFTMLTLVLPMLIPLLI